MTEPAPPTYDPLDLWCPTCSAAPGIRCVWIDPAGEVYSREPHAARVTASREASCAARRRSTQRRRASPRQQRQPGSK